MRRLAQAPPTPFIDGPKSVLSTAHAKHRCGRIPKVRQTARAAAPSRSGTLADCARQPAHSHRRFSMVENRSYRPPTPTCMQSIGVTGYPRSGKRPAPSRHRSPALSQTVLQPCHEGLRHQEVLGSAPHRSSRATTGKGRVRLACDYVGACVRAFACTPSQWAARRSLCVRELNTGGRFERSMVEHRSHLPSPRAERGFFWMVCRLFRAMQLRQVSGERNKVPERIPRSVSAIRCHHRSRSRTSQVGGHVVRKWTRRVRKCPDPCPEMDTSLQIHT